MSKWLSSFCGKCQQIIHFELDLDTSGEKQMIQKLPFLILLCTSLSFAVILALVPNLTALWMNTRQLTDPLTFTTPHPQSSVSQAKSHDIQSSKKFDLCSQSFTMVSRNQADHEAASQVTNPSGLQKHIHSAAKKGALYGEAMSVINVAKEMLSHGKLEKASKLFQHAFALIPSDPDILTEYGEYLEHHQQDILTAEHMYCKALINCPSHTKALVNRQRTLPLVEEIDQNCFNALDKKRKILLGIPENHPGVRRMMQESYFRHIYHTTAIEGNTFTLSQTRMLVETRVAIGGKSVMEHNEILGMDAAFTFVNDSLINRLGYLTVQDIKNIQKRVLGFVDPIESGEFRTTQVFVGDYEPPFSDEVPNMMVEFIDWLNGEDALGLHPIELAAIAHYKLVWIHPFYDGNGRTSRLLMNLILMQAGFPPIIVKVEEKHVYYEHLETANNGDIRPFMRFIAKCTERAIDEYLLAGIENAGSLISNIKQLKDDSRTIIIEEYTNQNIP